MSSLSHRTVISSPALIGRKTCNIRENNRHFSSELKLTWISTLAWLFEINRALGFESWLLYDGGPPSIDLGVWKVQNNINNQFYSHLSLIFSKSGTSSMQLKFPTRYSGFCPSSNLFRAINLVPVELKQSIIDEWYHRLSTNVSVENLWNDTCYFGQYSILHNLFGFVNSTTGRAWRSQNEF